MHKIFETPSYRVLETIHDNTLTVGPSSYCPLSQDEIATKLQYSLVYVNKLFNGLRDGGFIESMGRSKWRLTQKGIDAYDSLKGI